MRELIPNASSLIRLEMQMNSPTNRAIRLRLSPQIALTVLVQLAALLALSGCVLPQPVMDVPTATVTFNPADLTTERGVRNLYRRIEWAARQVCPDYDPFDRFELNRPSRSLACQRRAIRDAVRQIGSPRLARINTAIRSPQG